MDNAQDGHNSRDDDEQGEGDVLAAEPGVEESLEIGSYHMNVDETSCLDHLQIPLDFEHVQRFGACHEHVFLCPVFGFCEPELKQDGAANERC